MMYRSHIAYGFENSLCSHVGDVSFKSHFGGPRSLVRFEWCAHIKLPYLVQAGHLVTPTLMRESVV
jgi:hypothetical protein